ncbi:putative disease resistance protein RGA1 [Corylus avellana]|uniref:putative disease resistance protein RGA1 n=1 Tax=Corylus avellana TaxID=13451 RepID=UPI00286A98E7|nr:putative disease resistance protein RGA1 [Corylus avellana]
MAKPALFHIAASIIRSLGSLALQEIGLLWGFKDELQKLKNTVSTIQAVLLDVEEKQTHNHGVKDWLGKLKDAMYDADDLLDDFSTQLLRRQVMTRDKKVGKEVHIFFSKSNQLVYGLKMGHRIKAVRARLNEIADDKIKFGFTERLIMTHEFEHRKREDIHSFVPEEQVIGREGEKKPTQELTELLLDPNVEENAFVIPIVGIGGLGKTTLAQYVFNDDEVKRHFELRLWVCVSDPFDVKIIVAQLIESATKRSPESLEMDLLQSQLRVEIDRKLYLLVLDDVWSENRGTWLNLETLLSGGLKGSKVLITTRSKRVAEITGPVSPYLLGGLFESNSWNLFKKMAFKDGEEPKNQKLIEIGRDIVLIHLWAAQGFLHSSYGNRHLEDIGRKYFMDLLLRSFFQDVQRDGFGKIVKCKMHDLIHDLSQSITGEECTILYPNGENVVGRTRYVTFHSSDSLLDIPTLLPKAKKMRILLLGIPILPGFVDLFNVNIAGLEHSRSSPSEAKDANLERKRQLQHLILEWNPEYGDGSDKAIANDEQQLQNLRPHLNLKSLYIIGNCPMMSLTRPSSSSPLSDLSKLKYLYLMELEQLEYVPLEWLQNLTSLETLKIWNCCKTMSPLFQHLTSLKNLCIFRCKELISNKNEDGAHGLGPTRFGHLSIVGVPNLVSLPRELRDVTTLQGLQIMDFPSLVSFPEWIGDLTSLQELGVVNCLNLISLPEGMCRLTECPWLEERCEQGRGVDWPKIAHILNFRIGGDGHCKEWTANQSHQFLEEQSKILHMDASSDLANNQICAKL